jgi:hypothetical protein
MNKYFARIVYAGQDRNGNTIQRVYIYESLDYKPEEYNYLSRDDMKILNFGKVYADKHYIRTQWRKDEIIERLKTVYPNINYIFE